MTCQATRQLLPLFVEGDLPRRKADGVRRHVELCHECRGLCEGYRQTQQWLRSSPGPVVGGAALEGLRKSVWRRIEAEPRPAPLWLAIERGWAALRRWASQPAIAGAAVMLVVVGSLTLTRVGGLGGSRLVDTSMGVDHARESMFHETADEVATGETSDDPETILAQATPDEMTDGMEPSESETTDSAAANAMRIEIQTRDPNVRIIWFTPPADKPAVEN